VVGKRSSGRARECARETRSERAKGKGEKEREELIQIEAAACSWGIG